MTSFDDDLCPERLHGAGAKPWMRTGLYFGQSRPDGSLIAEADWEHFLQSEVTTRFPAGLTVTHADGQWGSVGAIVRERSRIVVVIYPAERAEASSLLLEEIRRAYVTEFSQDSVMREDAAPVCASF
ncbi:MAG: DUF3574 domain-containing protein [Thermomicrobiales bacterium]